MRRNADSLNAWRSLHPASGRVGRASGRGGAARQKPASNRRLALRARSSRTSRKQGVTQSLRHHRAGYTLVFFAMILFGIMALAALVIDIGFARLTQRQMKQATDTAAIEGLLKSDVEASSPDTFVGRTADTELGRRQVAADVVTDLFDDDFDDSADARDFGAGPQVELTGGVALNDGFFASQNLSIPNPPVYKPQLHLNTGNDSAGDIYTTATSMQIRLQRNRAGIGAGVSSNGGPVPYLFARGTLMSPETKAKGMNFIVTSTAEMSPVVRIGTQQTVSGVDIAGGISFAVTRAVWESLVAGSATSITLAGGNVGSTATVLTEIGQAATLLPSAAVDDGYCPIVESVSGTIRVIGFGWIQVAVDPANASNVLVTKNRDSSASETVAPENATARLSEAWNSLSLLTETDRTTVIMANRSLSDPLVSALLTEG